MSDSLRILWLKTGPLHPLDTGGKLRTYNLLRELNRRHEVTFMALKETGLSRSDAILTSASEYSTHQRWFDWSEVSKQSLGFYFDLLKNFCLSRRPYVIDKYRSAAMSESIVEMDAKGELDSIICDFLTPAVNLLTTLDRQLKTPTLLFQHNVEAQIWKRMAEKSKNFIQRGYFNGQWQRMQRYEAASSAQMNSVVGVSKVDCDQMANEYRLDNVIGAVSTGVDIDYFSCREAGVKTNQIVFLGSMDWLPNIDAVVYFVDKIWPAVKRGNPAAEFLIVGRRPTAAVMALAERDSAITVTGTVPDVRPFMTKAAAIVVPLRIGGGTRIKIFEAMSMGVPVISSTIGAEGLDVNPGENILIEDEPESVADAILGLLENHVEAGRIGQAAAEHVRAHYSWSQVARDFEKFCYATVKQ